MPGTKITLIALDEGSKAYYYNVESGVKQIDFTSFKDMDGNPYHLKDVKTYQYQTSYTDVCNVEYNSDVVVERFVLFVDTSDVGNSTDE